MARVQLTLTSMTQGGEAMGRDETGRVVFVPYAIAGEEIIAEIVEEKKSYARARVGEVDTSPPAPPRPPPRLPPSPPPPPPPPPPGAGGGGGGGGRGVRG